MDDDFSKEHAYDSRDEQIYGCSTTSTPWPTSTSTATVQQQHQHQQQQQQQHMYGYDSREEHVYKPREEHAYGLRDEQSPPEPQSQQPQSLPLSQQSPQPSRKRSFIGEERHTKKGNQKPKTRIKVKERINIMNADETIELELSSDCGKCGTHTPVGPCRKNRNCRRVLLNTFVDKYGNKIGKNVLFDKIRELRWEIVNMASDEARLSRLQREVGRHNRNSSTTIPTGDDFFNVHICLSSLCWIHGFSDTKYRQFLRSTPPIDRRRKIIDEDGGIYSVPSNTGKRGLSAIAWMKSAVKEFGCASPTNPDITYMGCYSITRDLAAIYEDDCRDNNENPITAKYFSKLFRGKFGKHKGPGKRSHDCPEVRMRNGEAGKCEVCLRAQASFRTGTPVQRHQKKREFKGHLLYIARARSAYAMSREAAALKAGIRSALSVGMDATAYFSTRMPIPHRCVRDPASKREKVKVTMCVVHHYHGEPSHCLRLATPPWIPGIGSQQIHLILCEVLPYMLEEYQVKKVKPPKKLLIQTDRGVDMWQATYHPMWSWVVEQGIFDEIQHTALPVGHSHDDYDRVGAIMKRYTRDTPGHGALTFAGLGRLKEMKHSNYRFVGAVLDFCAWFLPCVDPELSQHRKPLQYKYVRVNKPEMLVETFYREHIGAEFKSIGNQLKIQPVGMPKPLDWDNDFQHGDLAKWRTTLLKYIQDDLNEDELVGYGYEQSTARETAVKETNDFFASIPNVNGCVCWCCNNYVSNAEYPMQCVWPPSYLEPGAFGGSNQPQIAPTPPNTNEGLPPNVVVTSTSGVTKKALREQKKRAEREDKLNKELDPCELRVGETHVAYANEEPLFYLCKIVKNVNEHKGRLTATATHVLADDVDQNVVVRWYRLMSTNLDVSPVYLKWKLQNTDQTDECCASLIGPLIKVNKSGFINKSSVELFESVIDWIGDENSDISDDNSDDEEYDSGIVN